MTKQSGLSTRGLDAIREGDRYCLGSIDFNSLSIKDNAYNL